MIDEEITRVLAEKVMGWPVASSPAERRALQVRAHVRANGGPGDLLRGRSRSTRTHCALKLKGCRSTARTG